MSSKVIFIPGGAGLSSNGFKFQKDLDNENFSFFDPMGTVSALKTEPTYENLLSELKEYVNQFESVILVGHSFGAFQAAELSDLENVKGVILVSPPILEDVLIHLGENFSSYQKKPQLEITTFLDNDPSDELYAKWYKEHTDIYFTDQTHANLVFDDQVCVKSYQLANSKIVGKDHLLRKLNKVNIKTLIISGSKDKIVPEKFAKKQSELTNSELKIIKNCGHFPFIEKSHEFNSILHEFLKGL